MEDEVIVQSEPKAADPQAKSGPSNKDVNQPVEAKKTTTATAEVGKGVEEGRRAVREALQKARSKVRASFPQLFGYLLTYSLLPLARMVRRTQRLLSLHLLRPPR